jgi:endo-1,4-beta-D-glucanase Y
MLMSNRFEIHVMTQPAPALSSTKGKQKKDARDIRAEALKIANTIKTEGQTTVETKAIANGIQRGMELFLRQQSEKSRDLDKRVKKVKQLATKLTQDKPADAKVDIVNTQASSRLPWVLLAASWGLFLVVAAVWASH